MGEVLSVHIYFDMKYELCFEERSGMRGVLQLNYNVVLNQLTLLLQVGIRVL